MFLRHANRLALSESQLRVLFGLSSLRRLLQVGLRVEIQQQRWIFVLRKLVQRWIQKLAHVTVVSEEILRETQELQETCVTPEGPLRQVG